MPGIVGRVALYYAALTAAALVIWQFLPLPAREILRDSLRPLTSAAGTTAGFADALAGAPSAAPRPVSPPLVVALAVLAAFLLALPVAWTYMFTRRTKGYRQSVVHSLILLPVVVAGVVVLIKNSIVLAFGLAGIVAAVRFRNALDDSKDAVFIFFATVLGLAAGVQVDAAVVLSMLFIAVVLGLWFSDFARMPPGLEDERAQRQLERAMAIANRTSEFVARVDREVLEAMAPAQLEALARRVRRRRTEFDHDGVVPATEPVKTTIEIAVPDADGAQPSVEQALDEHCKRWRLTATRTTSDGSRLLEYVVTIKRSRTLADLTAALDRDGRTFTMRALALLLFVPSLVVGQSTTTARIEPSDSAIAATRLAAEAAARRTTRLFGDQTPLSFTLTADFGTVFRDRDTLSTKRYPATLTVADTAGKPVTIPLEINPRGHFRLDHCRFPPIKLNIEDGTARGTPFQGQEGLKLGTHCQPGRRDYEEYVHREHLIYRVYNLLTHISLRTRLARVVYVDQRQPNRPDTAWALLIEDEDDAARRVGGKIAELRRGRFDDVDREQMALIAVFHYFTGNTDWSLFALHNMRIIQRPTFELVPIAYDFDWSGLVQARYAKPDYRLPIKTVSERMYLGPCRTPEELEPILARFREHRPAIEALYSGATELDPGFVRWAKAFIADFYSVAADPRRMRRELIDGCEKESR